MDRFGIYNESSSRGQSQTGLTTTAKVSGNREDGDPEESWECKRQSWKSGLGRVGRVRIERAFSHRIDDNDLRIEHEHAIAYLHCYSLLHSFDLLCNTLGFWTSTLLSNWTFPELMSSYLSSACASGCRDLQKMTTHTEHLSTNGACPTDLFLLRLFTDFLRLLDLRFTWCLG